MLSPYDVHRAEFKQTVSVTFFREALIHFGYIFDEATRLVDFILSMPYNHGRFGICTWILLGEVVEIIPLGIDQTHIRAFLNLQATKVKEVAFTVENLFVSSHESIGLKNCAGNSPHHHLKFTRARTHAVSLSLSSSAA